MTQQQRTRTSAPPNACRTIASLRNVAFSLDSLGPFGLATLRVREGPLVPALASLEDAPPSQNWAHFRVREEPLAALRALLA